MGLAMVSRKGNWRFNQLTPLGYDAEWGYVNRNRLRERTTVGGRGRVYGIAANVAIEDGQPTKRVLDLWQSSEPDSRRGRGT